MLRVEQHGRLVWYDAMIQESRHGVQVCTGIRTVVVILEQRRRTIMKCSLHKASHCPVEDGYLEAVQPVSDILSLVTLVSNLKHVLVAEPED
jgi:hypothetical protein